MGRVKGRGEPVAATSLPPAGRRGGGRREVSADPAGSRASRRLAARLGIRSREDSREQREG